MELDDKVALSEICGLHAGDGYLRNDGKRIELDLSGSLEEKEYYDTYVIPLFSRYFNIEISGKCFPSRNTYGFVIRDKDIVKFMHMLGFPYGKKTQGVYAPKFIFSSKRNMVAFLRGMFDSDGCISFEKKHKNVYYYPKISIPTCSLDLFRDMCQILGILNIKFYIQIYHPKKDNWSTKYIIWIVGKERVNVWFETIGSKNSVKMIRYLLWKKYGFCSPRTTLKQRKQILKGKIDPKIYYGPVAQSG